MRLFDDPASGIGRSVNLNYPSPTSKLSLSCLDYASAHMDFNRRAGSRATCTQRPRLKPSGNREIRVGSSIMLGWRFGQRPVPSTLRG